MKEFLKVIYDNGVYYIIKEWYIDEHYGKRRVNGHCIYCGEPYYIYYNGELMHFSLHKKEIELDRDELMVEML
jgi:hypothetical protein